MDPEHESACARARSLLLVALASTACASTGADAPGPESGTAVAWNAAPQITDPFHRSFDLEVSSVQGPVTELITPVVGDGRAFDEVLPSWNVSPDLSFSVDVRVGKGTDTAFTEWLRIGDWNVDERSGDEPIGFEDGRVAVDVLRLDAPYERAQLRFSTRDVTGFGGDASGSTLEGVSIVLTDTRRIKERLSETAGEPWPQPVSLAVPSRSQRVEDKSIAHRICSPTSVAMVASYHGSEVPTAKVAATLLDPHFDIYGNWNRAVQGAYAIGVPGRLVRVSSWDAVRAFLDRGEPLIASIRVNKGELKGAPYEATKGHLLVVTGLGAHGAVLVNDPAASSTASVPRVYSRSDMETVWFANGGVAYAFEKRSGQ